MDNNNRQQMADFEMLDKVMKSKLDRDNVVAYLKPLVESENVGLSRTLEALSIVCDQEAHRLEVEDKHQEAAFWRRASNRIDEMARLAVISWCAPQHSSTKTSTSGGSK